jgi:Ca2+-binding EF-hand superfamily protein
MAFWTFFSLWLLAILPDQALSQQGGPPPLQPLGDVLMLVMDSNKDQAVTMSEVQSQLKTLEALFSQGGNDPEGSEYLDLLRGVQAVAPQIFELLDVNGDKVLKKKELKFMEKLEKSIQKGGTFKQLVRDCFAILDTNKDDEITMEEWKAADISAITASVHELFPLRPSAEELETVVQKLLVGSDANTETLSTGFFSSMDDNGDGALQRTEVGKAYNIAGRKFLEISKTIKQMGPMLAMFGGGMDMGGAGGGMRNEF